MHSNLWMERFRKVLTAFLPAGVLMSPTEVLTTCGCVLDLNVEVLFNRREKRQKRNTESLRSIYFIIAASLFINLYRPQNLENSRDFGCVIWLNLADT